MNHSSNVPCFPHTPQGFQIFQGIDHDMLSLSCGAAVATPSDALVYHVSVLRDKVQKLESLVGVMISPTAQQLRHEATAMAVSSAGSVVQDIATAASGMAHTLEQMVVDAASRTTTNEQLLMPRQIRSSPFDGASNNVIDHAFHTGMLGATTAAHAIDHSRNFSILTSTNTANDTSTSSSKDHGKMEQRVLSTTTANECDIVELHASDLLAKYTHYCQVCGKGFKRDANLRMHMRAHGDEYKTSAALSNPTKSTRTGIGSSVVDKGTNTGAKYSCPHEGCRWNRRHPRFQPLKSMVCVKNHYKRSHCPKMYVCKRCGSKQFSVLSDLHTHEKHCGERRWLCSCGTFFSRKDKLMGHVALFAGHAPVPATADMVR